MRHKSLIILATFAMGLSACGSGGGILGRDRPDEFAVQRQAPLVVPPDFSLAPPEPGAPRPSEGTAAEQALDALFGGPAPRSQVEAAALSRAGEADPKTQTVAKGRVTRDILAAPQGDGGSAQAVIPG